MNREPRTHFKQSLDKLSNTQWARVMRLRIFKIVESTFELKPSQKAPQAVNITQANQPIQEI